MPKELLYCGFDSHLPFTCSTKSTLKSLNALRWSPLQQIGNTIMDISWLGWCALYVRTEDGRLFHFGYDNPEQLPTGELCKVGENELTHLEWSSKRTFVCCSDGTLRKWSGNNFRKEPEVVEEVSSNSSKAVQVSAGTTFACVLFENGSVNGMEIDNDSPDTDTVTFSLPGERFTAIATGNEHMVLLTEKGRVYTYGRGSKGQLGHGCVEDELEDAKLVEALDGIPITTIAAGGWHSMAISDSGDLYAWGWNESGQLGFSKNQLPLTATPLPVDTPGAKESLSWKSVGCGSRHTMAMTECGQVYGFGWNKYGQLGMSAKDLPLVDKPTLVPLLGDNCKATRVTCKYWSSVIEC